MSAPAGPAVPDRDLQHAAACLSALLMGRAIRGMHYLCHEGEPQAKERARKGRGGQFYTPARTRAAEKALAYRFIAARRGETCTARTALATVFYTANDLRFDGDNALKLVKDAGNKPNGAAWTDDRLITVEGAWTEVDPERPRTLIAWAEFAGPEALPSPLSPPPNDSPRRGAAREERPVVISPTADARLLARLEPEGDCLVWPGHYTSAFRLYTTAASPPMDPHRAAWLLWWGPVPHGCVIVRTCVNMRCCWHLAALTPVEVAAAFPPRHHRGAASSQAKLTAGEVSSIREEHAAGRLSQTAAALRYGVSPSTINDLLSGRTWRPESSAGGRS